MSLSKRKREAFSLLLKNGGEDMKSGEVYVFNVGSLAFSCWR